MLVVTRLVNVHFKWKGIDNITWRFETVYDENTSSKSYYIYTTTRKCEVSKEQGNKVYKWIKEHLPSRSVIVIDLEANDVNYFRVMGHYEIRVNGEFKESCDTIQEAREARQKWIEILKKC